MLGRTWQNSSLLEHLLVPLLASTMYAAWVVPLVNAAFASFAFQPAGVEVPLWLPIAALYLANTLSRIAPEGRVGRAAVAAVGVTLSLAAALLLLPGRPPGSELVAYCWDHIRSWADGIPLVVGAFAVCVALWLRGVTIEWTDADSLRRGLIAGIVALGLLALLGGSTYGLGLTAEGGIGEAMLVFALSALMTLAFADIARSTAASARSGGPGTRLGRYWFGTVTLVVLALVAVAWLAGLVATPASAAALVQLLSPALRFLRDAFSYVILGIAYVIFWLLTPLINMLSSLTERPREEERLLEATAEATADLSEMAHTPVTVEVPHWAQVAVVVLVVALVAFAMYRAVRRRRPSSRDGVLETRELDWSWGQMQEQLRRLFGSSRRAARSQYLALAASADPRTVVRLAYRRVLALAEERGLGRQRGQTPSAYGTSLAQAMPHLAAPIDELTRAYVLARYGNTPPSADAVTAAVSAARQIEESVGRGETAGAAAATVSE